jgi:hypothetical protein
LTVGERANIKQLALAATPGPWHAGCLANDEAACNCQWVTNGGHAGSICTVDVGNGLRISDGGNDSPPLAEAKANLRYIAAVSPDVALRTLAYVERLEGQLVEKEREIQALVRGRASLLLDKYESELDIPDERDSFIADLQVRLTQAQTVRHPAGPWTEGLEANRQQLQDNYFAMKGRAEMAEARVASLLEELADQERQQLELVNEIEVLRKNGGEFYSRVFQAGVLSADEGEAYQWASDYPGYPARLAGIIKRLLNLPLPMPASPAPLPLQGEAGPADSQFPFDPGFTPKCHGCGLPSHAAKCRNEGCPAKHTVGTEPWRAVFNTQAEYDASVENIAARIASGEVKPIEQEAEQLAAAHWNGWVSREMLASSDDVESLYPPGLDYEDKEEYAFAKWYEATIGRLPAAHRTEITEKAQPYAPAPPLEGKAAAQGVAGPALPDSFTSDQLADDGTPLVFHRGQHKTE